jgi:hypothetical protein
MRRKIRLCYLLVLTLIISFSLYGADQNNNVLPYKKKLKEKIWEGEIFSESKVKSLVLVKDQKTMEIQELNFSIAGLHQKSCEYALKKLSLYENYSDFINFVKKSQYDEEKKEINFLLSHILLPYDMRLIFKLPRITKEGAYPFSFDQGILTDLKGTIYVEKINNRCLFYTKAHWSGPHTRIPNTIFEFFSQTLAKITMERLFRLSNTLGH